MATKKPSVKKNKPKKVTTERRFSLKTLLVFAVIFAGIGTYLLIRSFAAQVYVNYYGVLTAANPTAAYSLTTGTGELSLSFTNNTADATLVLSSSSGKVLNTLKSKGKTPVTLKIPVTADTYYLKLSSDAEFTGKKGYSVKIYYPEADTAAPSVVITKPLNTETISGTIALAADVNDNDGIDRVEFYINDTLVKTDTAGPYTTQWDSASVKNGQVSIKVKGFDKTGNVGEASGVTMVSNKLSVRFPGDPNPLVTKKAYWGSSIDGNGDPVKRQESVTGSSLSIRRTFWQWNDGTNLTSSMYRTVKDDIANNRLPFISVKPPTWKDVGDGKYDSDIDKMLKQLDSYGKPVWFVVHHEPEGGGGNGNTPDDPGGPKEWRRMQIRVRQRMNALGTKNVAFMPVVMSYTWNTASKRTPDDWWVDGIWDAYCVDHYHDNVSGNMLDTQWNSFVSWVEKKGLPFCLGEWGNRGNDADAAKEMQAFWDWGFNNKKDIVAYAYFDSGLNSPSGSWSLTGEPLAKFREILKSDSRVQRINAL